MLDALKQEIFEAIIYLNEQHVRDMGKGNVSLIDRTNNLIVTEPDGMNNLTDADDILVCDLFGNVVEGSGRPHRDLAAHVALYRAFPQIMSVAHSHTPYATAWAQAGRDIPIYGTSHMDVFAETVPCTREITAQEAEENYPVSMGTVIAEEFQKRSMDALQVPGVLLFQHGAFCWGGTVMNAIHHTVALERIAKMAYLTEKINPDVIGTKRNISKRIL